MSDAFYSHENYRQKLAGVPNGSAINLVVQRQSRLSLPTFSINLGFSLGFHFFFYWSPPTPASGGFSFHYLGGYVEMPGHSLSEPASLRSFALLMAPFQFAAALVIKSRFPARSQETPLKVVTDVTFSSWSLVSPRVKGSGSRQALKTPEDLRFLAKISVYCHKMWRTEQFGQEEV